MPRPNGTSTVLKAAAGHPLRWRVLEELRKQSAAVSPNALRKTLDEPLGNVSYHVRILAAAGLIKLAREEPRRGALEHYYELSEAGRDFLDALDALTAALAEKKGAKRAAA